MIYMKSRILPEDVQSSLDLNNPLGLSKNLVSGSKVLGNKYLFSSNTRLRIIISHTIDTICKELSGVESHKIIIKYNVQPKSYVLTWPDSNEFQQC
jgi:hypothetical protein